MNEIDLRKEWVEFNDEMGIVAPEETDMAFRFFWDKFMEHQKKRDANLLSLLVNEENHDIFTGARFLNKALAEVYNKGIRDSREIVEKYQKHN